jgi:EAL domain-containing protein (putative c-di-GMP-specific phosphodiesterase class I)
LPTSSVVPNPPRSFAPSSASDGLELPIVAEGVENSAQLAFLAREACDEVQGYLIGRPEPIETYSGLVGGAATPAGSLALAG